MVKQSFVIFTRNKIIVGALSIVLTAISFVGISHNSRLNFCREVERRGGLVGRSGIDWVRGSVFSRYFDPLRPITRVTIVNPTLKELEFLLDQNLIALEIESQSLDREHVQLIAEMERLASLTLNVKNLPPSSIRIFSGLPVLEILYIDSNNIRNDDIKQLSSLSTLKHLFILGLDDSTAISENALTLTSLESLVIEAEHFDDHVAANISNCSSLNYLALYNEEDSKIEISDLGLSYLVRINSIEFLHLSNSEITDEGTKFISDMNNLQVLLIPGSEKVTNESIEWFSKIASLRSLDVRGTGITDDSVRKLTSTKPGLDVSF